MDVYHSAVDVLIGALRRSGREAYLHAMVYFGQHNCSRSLLADQLAAGVERQMEGYHDSQLTGFLLVYSNKFINIVEGSESMLTQHLADVVAMMEKPDSDVGPLVKVFIETCHMKKRMFDDYQYALAAPPMMAAQFSSNPSAAEITRHYYTFYDKYFKLLELVRKSQIKSVPLNLDSQKSKSAMMLPEPELVQFLLKSGELVPIQEVITGRKCPRFFETYDDTIWPVPRSCMPYYVFSNDVELPSERTSLVQHVKITDAVADARETSGTLDTFSSIPQSGSPSVSQSTAQNNTPSPKKTAPAKDAPD